MYKLVAMDAESYTDYIIKIDNEAVEYLRHEDYRSEQEQYEILTRLINEWAGPKWYYGDRDFNSHYREYEILIG